MARPSKTHPFAIYDDSGIPTPDSTETISTNNTLTLQSSFSEKKEEEVEGNSPKQLDLPHILSRGPRLNEQEAYDGDDDRRASARTFTSISSYPDSTYNSDHDRAISTYAPFTPSGIRPAFRRPESVRRMQMSSPPPFHSRSSRRSVLSNSRSRAGTPRSMHALNARGSPVPRRRLSQDTEAEEQCRDELKEYPLVLLHVTLLPVNLPWSMESMRDLLPEKLLENLQLLKSKATDTVLERGILIPHPREEYEMLEERLLEALELKEERVTKCGHFRARDSIGSESSGGGRDSDSGIGSSTTSEKSDGELCVTCRHHIRTAASGIRSGNKKWAIKVYAANGLMRVSAWAAAWNEMERVDVEIMPWIGDEMRKKLDERREAEETREREALEDEEARIRELVEEQVRLTYEEMKRKEGGELKRDLREAIDVENMAQASTSPELPPSSSMKESAGITNSPQSDLPAIYPRSQIPLSILLKNYIWLLAQDRRSVAMCFLAIIAVFIALRPTAAVPRSDVMISPADVMAVHQLSVPEWATAVEDTAAEKSEELSDLVSQAVTSSETNLTSGIAANGSTELTPPPVVSHVPVENVETAPSSQNKDQHDDSGRETLFGQADVTEQMGSSDAADESRTGGLLEVAARL